MATKDPKVYLLKIVNDSETLYKIGYTGESIHRRISELQTGCPYEIQLVDVYSSEYSRVIEMTLHHIFEHKNTRGEWFNLDYEDEMNFIKLCEKYNSIQESMNNDFDDF